MCVRKKIILKSTGRCIAERLSASDRVRRPLPARPEADATKFQLSTLGGDIEMMGLPRGALTFELGPVQNCGSSCVEKPDNFHCVFLTDIDYMIVCFPNIEEK
jgi:hypothetical protein